MIALFIRVLNGESPDAILTADMSFIDPHRPGDHQSGVDDRANRQAWDRR
jgi:hypothetical protein